LAIRKTSRTEAQDLEIATMSTGRIRWVAMMLICLACALSASGQPAAPDASAPPAKASNAAAAATARPTTDAERKAEILGSDCWRRAMFELNEWLRIQTVHPPDEVARIKADFSARVDQMSASELQFVLSDLEAKFRILDTQQAREVRAWLGNYLSIISDRRRDELLKTIPDFATMSSMQLQQSIDRLAKRRDTGVRRQARDQQLRNSATNPWAQANPAASRSSSRPSYRSPYRPPSFERPFDNVQTGGGGRTIDPYGRVWLNMSF
jgi:hypothetical protein